MADGCFHAALVACLVYNDVMGVVYTCGDVDVGDGKYSDTHSNTYRGSNEL